MNIVEYSKVLLEDFQSILGDANIDFQKFKEARILVSGATGFVGSLLIKSLLFANQTLHLDLKIIALARNPKKVEQVFGKLSLEEVQFIYGDISTPFEKYFTSIECVDYIFHTANVTTSSYMVSNPVDTILTSVEGTNQMLRIADYYKVKSMVYLSSMEMYGTFVRDDVQKRRNESELGYIDPLVVRNCYPEGKRMCESLCVAYHSQYQIPVKIARLAQTFGAGILPWESRVFAHLCDCVINRQDIILHTKGLSEGNYCYSSDMIRALLIILQKGENAAAYNVVNESTHTTIAEMANMVAKEIAQNTIQVVYDISSDNLYGYAADVKLKLSGEKLMHLGWSPYYTLQEMYQRTIADRQGIKGVQQNI